MIDNDFNSAYPWCISCPPKHGEQLSLAFERITPKTFKVQSVDRFTEATRCIWRVKYALADGKHLPDNPELKDLVAKLTQYAPGNAVVIGKALDFPKTVEITYAVICSCVQKDFNSAAAQKAKVQQKKVFDTAFCK